jgi:hypothetical protein
MYKFLLPSPNGVFHYETKDIREVFAILVTFPNAEWEQS